MKKCIIVGAGFVGATFYECLHRTSDWNFYAYDLNPKKSKLQKDWEKERWQTHECGIECFDLIDWDINWIESLEEQKDAHLFIISVPTPMNFETGECHLNIVEDAVKSVRQVNKDSWIVLKSTVPPGTTQRLNQEYGKVCFNAEFLTEKNCFNDFKTLPYQIIGYPEFMPGLMDTLDCPLEELFVQAVKDGLIEAESVYSVDCTTLECVKYFRNTYLALRLSFCNEWYDICQSLNVDYDKVAQLSGLDARVGAHYNKVTAERGWGLSCFPKDLNSMIFVQKQLGLNPTMMKATWEKNLEVRKSEFRDWEKMEKAVVKKDSK